MNIKQILRILSAGVFLGVMIVGTIPVVLHAEDVGQSKPALTPQQQDVLASFAADVADNPPVVEIYASLKPPYTYYNTQVAPQDAKHPFDALEKILQGAGFILSHRYGGGNFTASLSCGRWSDNDVSWYHNNNVCGHDVDTSHVGTIELHNGRLGLSVFLESSKVFPKGSEVMSIEWEFSCSYSGSENGKEKCAVTLLEISGAYGSMVKATIPEHPQDHPQGGIVGQSMIGWLIVPPVLFLLLCGWWWFKRSFKRSVSSDAGRK